LIWLVGERELLHLPPKLQVLAELTDADDTMDVASPAVRE
jgi:hypothetical protein